MSEPDAGEPRGPAWRRIGYVVVVAAAVVFAVVPLMWMASTNNTG